MSNQLNELERETGYPIVRGKRRAVKTDGLQVEREEGKRRASVRDFHSVRVTSITLALAAGVPLELVQRVTGHRTPEVVVDTSLCPIASWSVRMSDRRPAIAAHARPVAHRYGERTQAKPSSHCRNTRAPRAPRFRRPAQGLRPTACAPPQSV